MRSKTVLYWIKRKVRQPDEDLCHATSRQPKTTLHQHRHLQGRNLCYTFGKLHMMKARFGTTAHPANLDKPAQIASLEKAKRGSESLENVPASMQLVRNEWFPFHLFCCAFCHLTPTSSTWRTIQRESAVLQDVGITHLVAELQNCSVCVVLLSLLLHGGPAQSHRSLHFSSTRHAKILAHGSLTDPEHQRGQGNTASTSQSSSTFWTCESAEGLRKQLQISTMRTPPKRG